MTEIAKCRCGADDTSFQRRGDALLARYCITCGMRGPWCNTEDEAIAAWNELSSALAWIEERVMAAGFEVEERP